MRSWKRAGINIVVSLLTSRETLEFELSDEQKLVSAEGMKFLPFPIDDRSVPQSRSAAIGFVQQLVDALNRGKNVGIHCRQGIGRSATIAATLLAVSGVDPETAMQRVSTARGIPVPETPEQMEWVIQLSRIATPVAPR